MINKKEDSSISIEYEKGKGIFLRFYDEGFFSNEIDITDIAQDCVIERLMDESDLQIGDEIVFRKEKEAPQPLKKSIGRIKSK